MNFWLFHGITPPPDLSLFLETSTIIRCFLMKMLYFSSRCPMNDVLLMIFLMFVSFFFEILSISPSHVKFDNWYILIMSPSDMLFTELFSVKIDDSRFASFHCLWWLVNIHFMHRLELKLKLYPCEGHHCIFCACWKN